MHRKSKQMALDDVQLKETKSQPATTSIFRLKIILNIFDYKWLVQQS